MNDEVEVKADEGSGGTKVFDDALRSKKRLVCC